MNASQFSQALMGLINSALLNGVNQQRMDASQVVGILELHKADLVRTLQDNAKQQTDIVKVHRIPPNGL